MTWQKLMSSQRFRGLEPRPGTDEESGSERSWRGPFLKDLDRIVYSSAFRRLQDKTQVYPFPESDYVRTRLTHSIEASSVGRSLGLAVGREIVARHRLNQHDISASDFGEVVAAAAMAHDIGHPPFGHAGDEAIRHWFRDDQPELLSGCTAAQQEDLRSFESNAQGFRLISNLQFWRGRGGMQLTAATLGAFSKYPKGSVGLHGPNAKFGYFQDDREAFRWVAEEVGLNQIGQSGENTWSRHPLAFLVEAADDICYLIVDIEDGFKAKRLTFREVEELLLAIVGKGPMSYRELKGQGDQVSYLRSKAIGVLIDEVIQIFLDNEKGIIDGHFSVPLLEETSRRDAVRAIQDLSRERLYNDDKKLRVEIAGFSVVRGLLEIYTDALLALETAGFEYSAVAYLHKKVLRLLPGIDEVPRSRYEWLLWITDYVSGMTDRYAGTQFKILRGIDIGDMVV